jgi:hypothetical protein
MAAAKTEAVQAEPTPLSSNQEAIYTTQIAILKEEVNKLTLQLADMSKLVKASEVAAVEGGKQPRALVRILGTRDIAIGEQLFGDETNGLTEGVHFELR